MQCEFANPTRDRRAFLKVLAGTGLTVACWFENPVAHGAERFAIPTPAPPPEAPPTAFVQISEDNTVLVLVKHLEMGQGVFTGVPTLVAEELDAAWSQIRVEPAPADAALYHNLLNGGIQVTGQSTSIANSFAQYRLAAAAARSMIVAAAAERWKVPLNAIRIDSGVVHDIAGHSERFGSLAAAAALQQIPQRPQLKDPSQFRLIGKVTQRTDAVAKSTGRAIFTQDFRLPGMLTAVVIHPPRFGARLRSFDAAGITGKDGVQCVLPIPTGVAIIAKDFWSAKTARDKLSITWDTSTAMSASSSDILNEHRGLLEKPGTWVRAVGDAADPMSHASRQLEAVYEFPYLAHATMEPMNCVMRLQTDRCDAWYAIQSPTNDQSVIASLVGLPPQKVFMHQLLAGGSFGRRASSFPATDYVGETASIVKALAGRGIVDVPVKLMWTREDDMRADRYRPAFVHAIRGGLDVDGKLVAWQQRIVGQSISAGTLVAFKIKDGVDPYSVDGIATLPYDIPNLYVDLHSPAVPIPVLWWRSVGSSHCAFAIETFIDRLAAMAGQNPVAFRRHMIQGHPRHLAVLDLAAEKAGWGSPLESTAEDHRRARGFALHESYNSVVAQVVEITVAPNKTFTVDRVVCAVHCGLAVNPDVIRSQMESGVAFGLSAALYGEVTVKEGAIEQSNFHDYRVIRMEEMPTVETHIVTSNDPPTGVGEPGVPPIAPAVANALAAATGQWLTRLPLALA